MPSTNHNKSPKGGFSLIELLVVVAIIAVLASLLLPALSSAKEKSKSSLCKANIRQWGYALSMYLDDNDRFPSYWVRDSTRADAPPSSGVILNEVLELRPYFKNLANSQAGGYLVRGGVYHCPSSPDPIKFDRMIQFFNPGYGPNVYGTDRMRNRTIGVGGDPLTTPLRGNGVKAPNDFIVFGDGVSIGGICPTTFPAVDGTQTYYPGNYHTGGANVGFLDAHVEYSKQTNWVKHVPEVMRRWNADHEPHPETW